MVRAIIYDKENHQIHTIDQRFAFFFLITKMMNQLSKLIPIHCLFIN